LKPKPNDFAAYTGVAFGVIAIFLAIRYFEQSLILPGMEVGEEHRAFVLARMYGILTGLPIGAITGFATGKLIQYLLSQMKKEKAQ
jgi:hypothetical protein